MTVTPKSLRDRVDAAVLAAGGQYDPGLSISLNVMQVLELANQLDALNRSPEKEQHNNAIRRAARREVMAEQDARMDALRLGIVRRLAAPNNAHSIRAMLAAGPLLTALQDALSAPSPDLEEFLEKTELAFKTLEHLRDIAAMDIPVSADLPSVQTAIRIDDLEADLSTRTRNCLRMEGLSTLGDLTHRKRSELLRIPGLGSKGMTEIEACLSVRGMSLAG